MRRLTYALLAGLVASSCGEPSGTTDAAVDDFRDAATAPLDAAQAQGSNDAGALPGLDAQGTGGTDDAAADPPDAAAPTADGGGEPTCPASFAGCASYVDATANDAGRTVSFTSFQYVPKCLRIAAGQSVTFSGSFAVHPLKQACGPAAVIAPTASGSSATFVFEAPGAYGYFCSAHGTEGGSGMAGSVLVE